MELVKSLFKYSGEYVVIQHEAGCKTPRSRNTHGKIIADLDKLHAKTLHKKLAKTRGIDIICAVVPNVLVDMGLPVRGFTYTAEELVDAELAKISRLTISKLVIMCNSVSADCGTYHFNSDRVNITPAVIPYVDAEAITVDGDNHLLVRNITVSALPPSVRSLTFTSRTDNVWVEPSALGQLEYFRATNANFADYKGTPLHPKFVCVVGGRIPIELQLDNCLLRTDYDTRLSKVIKAIYVLRYLMSISGC